MKLLLDTHIFLWWDHRLRSVSRQLRAAIEDEANDVYISAASVWEIAVKRAIGKLSFRPQIVERIAKFRFELLPIGGFHAEFAGGLPRHHKDPFDRMLIAQAIVERMVLGTQDPMMRPYGVPTLGLD